jgi:hypothetical protein
LLAMLPTAGFNDDRVNALSMQEVREYKTRRSRPHDRHLRSYLHYLARLDF